MPLFYYWCEPCQNRFYKLLQTAPTSQKVECPKCSGEAVRAPQAPTTKSMEKIDNGLMARAVERPADAERMFKERSQVDYEEKDAIRRDFKPVK